MTYSLISSIICCFGIVFNFCMIILLTRPHLRSTINRLWIAMAVSNVLLMFSYLIYIIHFEFSDDSLCPINLLTYGWVVFQLLHHNCSVYFRAFTLWTSVVIAGYRQYVLSEKTIHHKEKLGFALKLVFIIFISVTIACVPIFLQNTIIQGPSAPENDSVCSKNHNVYYTLNAPDYLFGDGHLLLSVIYLTNGFILKLCPCLFLSYYFIRIVYFIYLKSQNRKLHLSNNIALANDERCVSCQVSLKTPTSFILIIILLITIMCELPNAVLSFMASLNPDRYLRNTYRRFGDLLNMLSLFSSTTTSILYFILSRELRKTFSTIFSLVQELEQPPQQPTRKACNRRVNSRLKNNQDENECIMSLT